jgi:hypothetical protein
MNTEKTDKNDELLGDLRKASILAELKPQLVSVSFFCPICVHLWPIMLYVDKPKAYRTLD